MKAYQEEREEESERDELPQIDEAINLLHIQNLKPLEFTIASHTISHTAPPETNIKDYVLEYKSEILKFLRKFKNIKYQITVKVVLVNINNIKEGDNKEDAYITKSIRSEQIRKLKNDRINLSEDIKHFEEQLDSDLLKVKGSGWSIDHFICIKIHVAKINVLL